VSLPFPDPALTDGVVGLRPWRDEDAVAKVGWAGDADIVRWTSVPVGYTAAAARRWAAGLEADRRAGRQVGLAIVDAGSDRLLGSCDLRRPARDDPALGEVGYLLAPEARGRGAATRAMWLFVDWSFRTLAMGRVQALVHPENPRSADVLVRLGFRREGLLRAYRAGDEGREDRVLFSVLPHELTRPARG
jgi:RimJ/RimL family protein N-acetyltransferase